MPDNITLKDTHRKRRRMFLGCDAHRKYSVFVAMDEQGRTSAPVRVEHRLKELRLFLRRVPPGTEVAVEATGSIGWWTRSRRRD